MVEGGHVAKIPEGTSFEDAFTLGIGVTTVGQALYMILKLPLPVEPARTTFPV
jgi:NADPH:quinone reductase-like Zn-dependent oxidoreductase